MREKQIFGYVRVSAKDQNEVRQLDALAGFGIPKGNLYVEKQSGKDFDRPTYKRLLKRLQPADLLMIQSIDRLGRNYEEILEQWRIITKERQANIAVLDFPLLDTRARNSNEDLTGRRDETCTLCRSRSDGRQTRYGFTFYAETRII